MTGTDLVESTETVGGRDDPAPVEERPAALDLLLGSDWSTSMSNVASSLMP